MVLFTVDSQNTFGKSVAEAGSYNVKISPDSEYKPTKKQDDMAVLHYEVVDGAYRGGKIMYDNIVWQKENVELSQKRFNTLLAALGIPDGTPIESIQKLVQGVKGKPLNITVEWVQNETNGKWNLHVKSYRKTDTAGSQPNGVKRPNDQQAQEQTPYKEPQQQSLPGVDPFLSITDDDLPFRTREVNKLWTLSSFIRRLKFCQSLNHWSQECSCFGISLLQLPTLPTGPKIYLQQT